MSENRPRARRPEASAGALLGDARRHRAVPLGRSRGQSRAFLVVVGVENQTGRRGDDSEQTRPPAGYDDDEPQHLLASTAAWSNRLAKLVASERRPGDAAVSAALRKSRMGGAGLAAGVSRHHHRCQVVTARSA